MSMITPDDAAVRAQPTDMFTRPYRARVYTDGAPDLCSLRDSNVLLYFPHGFGDWVQLSYILHSLERSNRYWITRFGDDSVSLMEGHDWVSPIYMGINNTHNNDGGNFNNRHFGLEYSDLNGEVCDVVLPLPVYEECRSQNIQNVMWTAFPETGGHVPPPYHTKSRYFLRMWRGEDALTNLRLDRPLKTSVSFQVPPHVTRWVESRLKTWGGFGHRKLCIIGRGGYTSIGKNWGHLFREDLPPSRRREGQECREFIQLMLKRDPRWMFLLMEDRLFDGDDTLRSVDCNSFSYAELFGTPDTSSLPFGLVMRALVNLADLSVGVPAGPHHLSMAKPELPTIGIWTEHLPSWFDEPKAGSLHLVSRNVIDRELMERPGSFSKWEGLEYRLIHAENRIISADLVMAAVELLLN